MLVLAFATTVFAQDGSSFEVDISNPQSQSNEYVCATGSVFSQFEADATGGLFCQEGYGFPIATDDYTATGPFSTLRLWGVSIMGCTLDATESFDITIYDGDPSSTGMIVHQATYYGVVTAIPVLIGTSQTYQIDIDFGLTINQLSGWIAISRNGAMCGTLGFAWLYGGVGNSQSYGRINPSDPDTWIPKTKSLFFCLGTSFGAPPPVPLSNWPIYAGILLIGGFIVIRYRKKLAIG